jgi:hypothetical protein
VARLRDDLVVERSSHGAVPFRSMRRAFALLALSLAFAACRTHASRGAPPAEIDAEDFRLPAGVAAGAYVTWTTEATGFEPDDVREETQACVEEREGVVTMERRETLGDGSVRVTATRFRRDGTLLGAWRGPPDGVGAPVRVRATAPFDVAAASAEVDAMRRAAGLPAPSVATSQATEWIDTPAGRFQCVKNSTDVSILGFRAGGTTWRAVDPQPISPLVKMDFVAPGYRMTMTRTASGTTGARPTLLIP